MRPRVFRPSELVVVVFVFVPDRKSKGTHIIGCLSVPLQLHSQDTCSLNLARQNDESNSQRRQKMSIWRSNANELQNFPCIV